MSKLTREIADKIIIEVAWGQAMNTLKIKLSWQAFRAIRDKYPDRVLNDMNSGLFIFSDSYVTFHVSSLALELEKKSS